MNNKFSDIKKELFSIVPLILFFCIFLYITWGTWGLTFFDSFREVLVPKEILAGKVLYKDILCLYMPLGYQLNAFFVSIFDNGLNTFYWLGITNTLLFLGILYYILRKISNRATSFLTLFLILGTVIAKTEGVGNFIFPYSYSMVYALSMTIIAMLFTVLYIKNNSDKFLYLSILSIGISCAFKPDFILAVLIPLFFLLKDYKNLSVKKILLSIVLFFIPTFLSFGILAIQGFNFTDLGNLVQFWTNFNNAPSVIKYNNEVLYKNVSFGVLFNTVFVLGKIFLQMLIFPLIIALFIILWTKKEHKKISNILFYFFMCLLFLKAHSTGSVIGIKSQYFTAGVCVWIYFIHIAVIWTVLKSFINRSIDDNEKYFMIFAFFTYFGLARMILLPTGASTANIPMVLIPFTLGYWLLDVLPNYLKTQEKNIKIACYVCFPLISLIFFTFSIIPYLNYKETLQGKNGIYKVEGISDYAVFATIDYLKNNAENKTVIVAPEGEIINYFSNTKINPKYYSLITHMTETIGENNIINDLDKNPPDYFVIFNYPYETNGYWGIDYGKDIKEQFIDKNYSLVSTIKSPKTDNGLEAEIWRKE